jgi:hypothetical protein
MARFRFDTPAAEAAYASAARAAAPLRCRAERAYQPDIDVVEIARRRGDGMEVLAIAGLVRQGYERQQFLRGRVKPRRGYLIVHEREPCDGIDDRFGDRRQIAGTRR